MAERDQPERTLKLRSKSILIIVGLLILVQLLDSNRNWKFLLSSLGSAWLFSYLWAKSLKNGLRLEREMRFGWMQVGDRLLEHISIKNDGRAPALWVQVIDGSDMAGYEISTVVEVNGNSKRNWYTKEICQRRGVFTLGPICLETGDPFGLYQVRVEYSSTANMMVAPQIISIPEVKIAAGGRIGGVHSSSRGLEQTVTAGGVREYSPGDGLRRVHWPTTARKNEIFVHVYDSEPSSDWWVVLDMDPNVHVGEGQTSTEENGVTLAASIVNRGLQLNKSVGLMSQGQELVWHPPDSGQAQLWKVIRSLTNLRTGGLSLESVLGRVKNSIGDNTSLVIITPNLSLEWINALEMFQRAGIIPTVILLDSNTSESSGDIQAIRDHLSRLGVIHYVFTSDSLEPIKKDSGSSLDWLYFSRDRDWVEKRKTWFGTGFRQRLRNLGGVFLIFFGLVNVLGGGIRGVENNLLWFLVVSGMLTGWLFTKLWLTTWLFIPLSITAGTIFTVLKVIGLGEELKNTFSSFLGFLAEVYQWIFQASPSPDPSSFLDSLNEIWINLTLLANRLWTWINGLVQGEPYFDPVMVALFWGMLVWLVVTWAMWGVFKLKKPLLGSFPSILLVVITLINIGQFSNYLALMIGSTAGLIIYMNHDIREQVWKKLGLNSDDTIQSRMLIYGLGLAAGLMVFSILSSRFSVKSITEFFHALRTEEIRKSETARSFGLEPSTDSETIDFITSRKYGGLPNKHLLSGGPELSTQVVMYLEIEGITSDTLNADPLVPLRFIRNLTYDQYSVGGWISKDAEMLDYNRGDQLFPTVGKNQQVLRQSVNLAEEVSGSLFTIGIPLSVDHDFKIAWRLSLDEQGGFDIFGGTLNVDSYRADSIIPNINEEDLRNAGQIYPIWVQKRYLALPLSIPERVLTLARELTAKEPNPYDRAIAIEDYLRSFPYTLDVPIPSKNEDVSDYFLFTLKKGYCDYYATSMVVLARAAGIPARFVTGYVAETYDDERQSFIITADQAHAWVEIYFPGYGWVPFEPTAGRLGIVRHQNKFQAEFPELDLSLEPLIQSSSKRISLLARKIGFIMLGILSLVVAGVAGYEWRFVNQPASRLLPAIFSRIYWYGQQIGVESNPGDTTYEFLAKLEHHTEMLGNSKRIEMWLHKGKRPLHNLTETYQNLLFCEEKININQKQKIVYMYRKLRPKILVLWGLSKVYNFPVTRFVLRKEAPVRDDTINNKVI